MSSSLCITRLRKEYKELLKKPLENIRAIPKESNILEWHYVIEGPKGSIYEGGWYHGIVLFTNEYPYKPPSIQMYTPNGRFKPSTRLCLSMSDFHPESWNPMWSIGTILMGLYSFMLEDAPTYGSISTSDEYKKKVAQDSLYFNIKNKIFCELFPELLELYEEKQRKLEQDMKLLESNGKNNHHISNNHENNNNNITQTLGGGNGIVDNSTSWLAVISVFAAIVAFTWALLTLAL